MNHDKHKINETRKRSILKAVSGRMIEIAIGTFLQGRILAYLGLHSAYKLGFVLTLLEETICFLVCYVNERFWNRIDWGREIKDV